MKRELKLPNYKITKLHNRQRGYVLITLMLFFTLLAIAALAVAPKVAQQIRRDQEEEMIHRALQYSRGIRRYYKKFGRYPARIEELESTNNLRFIRKRYKDPITGKDFKLLRMGDPILAQMGFTGGMGQAGMLQGMQGQNFVAAAGGGIRPAAPGDANKPQVTGLPQAVNTSNVTPDSSSGDDKSDSSSSGTGGTSNSPFTGPTFGGGAILGVVSASKDTTIREFNKKNHYNEWLFIYDPMSDRGGMLNTPYQPSLTGNIVGNAMGVQPGAGPIQPQPNAGPQVSPPPQQPAPPNPQDSMPPDQ